MPYLPTRFNGPQAVDRDAAAMVQPSVRGQAVPDDAEHLILVTATIPVDVLQHTLEEVLRHAIEILMQRVGRDTGIYIRVRKAPHGDLQRRLGC